MDNISEMGWMHPDGDLPPRSDWLDDKALEEWRKSCDKLRKDQKSEAYDA